ncbi:NHL domain-containing protein [Forsythia ovata]|uniref:NHL domain-containing protein n=1 Tax=Forsythia ovata TaxID=205694 RepID=A0ABD1TST0_9LAMI
MEPREFSHQHAETIYEESDTLFQKSRCCFSFPCFNNSSPDSELTWWRKIRTPDIGNNFLWIRGVIAVKKIREWSELVAGPRWKTFIRRFNRNRSGNSKHMNYQYDPLSYAMNFDEGPGQSGNFEEEDGYYHMSRNFSSRYASIPASSKTSMDLGKDAPTFV